MNYASGVSSHGISSGLMFFRSGEDIQQEIIFRPEHDPDKPPPHQPGDIITVLGMMAGAVVGAIVGAAVATFLHVGNLFVDICLGAVLFAIIGTLLGERIRRFRPWKVSLVLLTPIVALSVAFALFSRQTPTTLGIQSVSDGANGAIVAWQSKDGLRVQRINDGGQTLWQTDGILVQENGTRGHGFFLLTADGVGGAIVTWENPYPMAIEAGHVRTFSQRISGDGGRLWGEELRTGMTVPSGSECWVIPDGTGGAIFGWNDYKTYFKGLHDDFFRLQKVSSSGQLLWGREGILVTASSPYHPLTNEEKTAGIPGESTRSSPTYSGYQMVVSDGAQGAIAVWHEIDNGNRTFRIYAQRVNAEGRFAWEQPFLLKTVSGFPTLLPVSNSDDKITLAMHVSDPSLTTWLVDFSVDGGDVSEHAVLNSPLIIDAGEGSFIALRAEDSPTGGPPTLRSVGLYLNKLDSEGKALWPDTPVVTTEAGMYPDPEMIIDGDGGGVLSWRLARMRDNSHGRVFAMGVDAEGNVAWGEGGLALFPDQSLEYQGRPKAIRSDSGTIVIAAVGTGAEQGDMVYAQKLDDTGQRLWGDGVRIDK